MEQLPQVAVGLKDARSLAALHPLFKLKDDALKQRGEQQGREDLRDLEDDVARHHARLRLALNASSKRDRTAFKE